jgi:hypothetical protein
MDIDKSIEILHDHYKESFSYIRQQEIYRDRNFIIVIIIFGFLFLQIQYPVDFQGALGKLSIKDAEINLNALPLAALLSITWTLLLVFTLRYCQSTINIERQYKYLHKLEGKISTILSDDEIYCREGKEYLNAYPLFSNWVWFFYTIMFPIIVIAAISALLSFELRILQYPNYHKVYDTILSAGIVISFILYRIVPLINKIRRK